MPIPGALFQGYHCCLCMIPVGNGHASKLTWQGDLASPSLTELTTIALSICMEDSSLVKIMTLCMAELIP